MGRIEWVSFEGIVPSEGGFYLRLLEGVFDFMKTGKRVCPIPVRLVDGRLVHMDGRHRLLAQRLIGRQGVEVFIAENDCDFMNRSEFPDAELSFINWSNRLISVRWEYASIFGRDFRRNGIDNYEQYFQSLVRQYPFLENEEGCRKKFAEDNPRRDNTLYTLSLPAQDFCHP